MNYGATNRVGDPGFELQTSSTISSPWAIEGPDSHGVDRGAGFAHSGANDAWMRDSTNNWNAITQTINVQQNTNYTLTGWVQNNFTTNLGYFGVRNSDGVTVLKEASFSAAPGDSLQTVKFNSGSNATVKVYAGFWGRECSRSIGLDDVAVQQGW